MEGRGRGRPRVVGVVKKVRGSRVPVQIVLSAASISGLLRRPHVVAPPACRPWMFTPLVPRDAEFCCGVHETCPQAPRAPWLRLRCRPGFHARLRPSPHCEPAAPSGGVDAAIVWRPRTRLNLGVCFPHYFWPGPWDVEGMFFCFLRVWTASFPRNRPRSRVMLGLVPSILVREAKELSRRRANRDSRDKPGNDGGGRSGIGFLLWR
jgi:hypothetical protein